MSDTSTATGEHHKESDGNEPVKRPRKCEPEENTHNNDTLETVSTMPVKPKPEAIFRIDETLTPILNHLEVVDLANAYNVDKKFRSIVLDIIGKKRIAFDEFQERVCAPKVFKLFGKHMTRLQINHYDVADYPANAEYTDFDKIIEIITMHCRPGNLVELEIYIPHPMFSRHTEQLLQRARPFFENVAELRLHRLLNNHNVERLFNEFPLHNLQTIRVDCKITTGNWLNSPELRNLQHLYIHDFVSGSVDFTRFIELHPNLKSFYCLRNKSIELIARHLPNIEYVGCLDDISHEQIRCFGRFNQLRYVEIRLKGNVYDLIEMMDNIPNKHVLEVLALQCFELGRNGEISNEAIINKLSTIMGQFKSLKCLRLFDLLGNANSQFTSTIFPQLNTVTKCTMIACSDLAHVQTMRFLKNLRVMFVKYGSFTGEWYRDLMETWKKRQEKESFSRSIVIYLGQDGYDTTMIKCRYIYDENVVRLEKYTGNNIDNFELE